MDITGQEYIASTSSHGNVNAWNAGTYVYSLPKNSSIKF